MREIKRIAVAEMSRDEDQPRKFFGEDELLNLGQSMHDLGQQVPCIGYLNGKGVMLLDGERRWRAAQLVGITALDAIVLPEKPTATALHVIQMSLEAHKVGLSAMERSNLLAKIQKENGWQVGELASKLHMKQPMVSKLLKFQTADGEVQRLLHSGQLDMEKAFIIAQEPDHAKQQLLLSAAPNLSRDQLRHRAKSHGSSETKASMARFAMPGMMVAVQGKDVTLITAIEVLTETVRVLRKGLAQGLDISTQQRVMRDQLKRRPS